MLANAVESLMLGNRELEGQVKVESKMSSKISSINSLYAAMGVVVDAVESLMLDNREREGQVKGEAKSSSIMSSRRSLLSEMNIDDRSDSIRELSSI